MKEMTIFLLGMSCGLLVTYGCWKPYPAIEDMKRSVPQQVLDTTEHRLPEHIPQTEKHESIVEITTWIPDGDGLIYAGFGYLPPLVIDDIKHGADVSVFWEKATPRLIVRRHR